MRTIVNELASIKHKWYEIGIQLGIPQIKLQQFKWDEHPLAAVVDYWLMNATVPISWKSIVIALESAHVGEIGVAKMISSKHCWQESEAG